MGGKFIPPEELNSEGMFNYLVTFAEDRNTLMWHHHISHDHACCYMANFGKDPCKDCCWHSKCAMIKSEEET